MIVMVDLPGVGVGDGVVSVVGVVDVVVRCSVQVEGVPGGEYQQC